MLNIIIEVIDTEEAKTRCHSMVEQRRVVLPEIDNNTERILLANTDRMC